MNHIDNRKNNGKIFISYRSRYFNKLKPLEKYVRNKFGANQTIYFLPPGRLVYENEILTEQRHWQLVSMIDHAIGAADEMWVYNTDDYLDSWWTRAELLTIAYRRACHSATPQIKIFNPISNTLSNESQNYIPTFNKTQKWRMARWYSNTDPGTMGPESLQVMHVYRQLPIIGRVKYFNDHVFSREFWEDPLLPCTECKKRGNPPNQNEVDAFLWIQEPGMVRLTVDLLQHSLLDGVITCPTCKTAYLIEVDKYPRYLWMPVRYGKPTGPDGSHIIELPVYRVGHTRH